jgi:hypothetical protein
LTKSDDPALWGERAERGWCRGLEGCAWREFEELNGSTMSGAGRSEGGDEGEPAELLVNRGGGVKIGVSSMCEICGVMCWKGMAIGVPGLPSLSLGTSFERGTGAKESGTVDMIKFPFSSTLTGLDEMRFTLRRRVLGSMPVIVDVEERKGEYAVNV